MFSSVLRPGSRCRRTLGSRQRIAIGAALALPLGLGSLSAIAPPAAAAPVTGPATVSDPASYVNTLIGTGSGGASVGTVDLYPGADVPFGMLQWSPDTPSMPPGGGYYYGDSSTSGFSLTHLSGAGCSAEGDVPILPTVGAIGSNPRGTTDAFSHSNETGAAGYYQVMLNPGTAQAVNAELTETLRSGIGRFTFPRGTQSNLLIKAGDSQNGNSGATVSIVGNNEVTGSTTSGHFCGMPDVYTLYYAIQFSQPFTSSGTWTGSGVSAGSTSASDSQAGAYVTFDTTSNKVVLAKVGISYVSVANALGNIANDDPGWNFTQVQQAAHRSWNAVLGSVAVGGGTSAELQSFYTAVYHSMLQPSVFSDANGQYMGFDNTVHTVSAPQKAQYDNFSGWDTYRSEVQLQALLQPMPTSDMMQSLVNDGEQGGWLPRWPLANGYTGVMNGDAADAIIADAYAYGARNFDAKSALALMIKGATQVPTSANAGQGWYVERRGLQPYMQLGYVPNTQSCCVSPVLNGASMTEEYAVGDFAISQLAGKLGDSTDASTFASRGQNWQNLLDPDNGYIQPKDGQGVFPAGPPVSFSGFGQSGFQEGNAAQYRWMVPQNVKGLINAMGGSATAVQQLDNLFTRLNAGPNAPYYWAGNEPALDTPWEYDYAGAPSKTQGTVRRLITQVYSNTPGGEPGNDDLGAMSSWYVWAALGLYPETPGVRDLVLGSPLFQTEKITMSTGHTLTIYGSNASAGTPYVQQAWIQTDGGKPTPWESPNIPGRQLSFNTTLYFDLGSSPTGWGSNPSAAPPSFTQGEAPVLGLTRPHSEIEVLPGASTNISFGGVNITSSPVTETWSVTAPSNVTVSPASGTFTVGGNGDRHMITVHITAGTAAGLGLLVFHLTDSKGKASPPVNLRVDVAPANSLLANFDNEGISSDSAPWGANYDGSGYSYSAQALAAAGLTPGATVTAGGGTFTWPDEPPSQLDNVQADGQTIDITGTGSEIGFLGSGSAGNATGPVTVTYTDGTTQTQQLGFTDWANFGCGTCKPQFGNQVVATMPYRNFAKGTPQQLTMFVYYAYVNVDPTKTVASITLPTVNQTSGGGGMHIFAMDLERVPTAFATPSSVTVAPGATGSSALGVFNPSNLPEAVAWTSSAPSGITVSPASGSFTVAANSAATTPLSISVAAGTMEGFYNVPFSVTTPSGTLSATLQVIVAKPGSLVPYFNSTCISSDTNTTVVNCDGDGFSYSEQALAAAGVTPGSTITAGGMTFSWPDVAVATPDNLTVSGQTIPISASAGAKTLGILGMATNGPSQGTMTLDYANGTTQTVNLGFSDWTLNGGSTSSPNFGNQIAVTTAHRNCDFSNGCMDNTKTYVFAAAIPLDTSTTLTKVVLPSSLDQGTMHVFAMTTS